MDLKREHAVSAVFVSLADSLVDGRDVMDFYAGLAADCARILDVAWAGVLLGDPEGALQVMAASSQRAHHLECYQVQSQEGPCVDCYRTGATVVVPDLGTETARWPRFAPIAVEAGFVSAHVVPMRLGDTVLGTLGLFGAGAGVLNAADLALAQAFAHVAGVALVVGRAVADKTVLAEQLQTALNSRVVLEQAKGILAQFGALEMDQAFAALRRYSRDHNQQLMQTAQAVASRGLTPAVVCAHARAKGVLE